MPRLSTTRIIFWLHSFLGLSILSVLWACTGGPGAPGGGAGNFATVPAHQAGTVAPNVDVLDGKLIKVRTQVTPTNGRVVDPAVVQILFKGQLIDKVGNVFPESAAGRTARLYEPTRRQMMDVPIQEGNFFEATLEVLPASFDPATLKVKSWCYFAVPLGFAGPLANAPTACPMPAPNCFPLDDTWIDFLDEDFLNNPCPLLNPPP